MGNLPIEVLLKDVEQTLIESLLSGRNPGKNQKDKKIRRIEKLLKNESNLIIVPTDKTNSFQVVKIQDCTRWVLSHLNKSAKVINPKLLEGIRKKALNLQEDYMDIFSKNEAGYLSELINTGAIPTPKLLIKDHKKLNKNNKFPTRLVVLATNFMAAFSRMGYMGIRKIFSGNKVDILKQTMVQAAHLKNKLESLNLKKGKVTIISLHTVNMYPAIEYSPVKKL